MTEKSEAVGTDGFESWAVIEVFGHKRYAGLVTEQTIGGCSFVRIDVPATDTRQAFTKLFGNGAIYAITPCSEEVARRASDAMWGVEMLPVHIPAEMVGIGSGGHDEF